MQIFAPGFYWWGNKGDLALSQAFIEWMHQVDPDASTEITFTSFRPDEDQSHYPGHEVLAMVTRPDSMVHRWLMRLARLVGQRPVANLFRCYAVLVVGYLRVWSKIFLRSRRLASFLASPRVSRIAAEVVDSDAVIAVPGGYLVAPGRDDYWWLFHVPTLMLAKHLGARVVLAPCSIGPFHPNSRPMARRVLKSVDMIFARERYTAQTLVDLGVARDRIMTCPDLAFIMPSKTLSAAGQTAMSELRRHAGKRPILGVSVRDHHFPQSEDPVERMVKYLEAVAGCCDRITARHNARVVVVAQTAEDVQTGRRLLDVIDHKQNVLLIEDDALTPNDLQHLYREMRLLVGTRMHANILALSVGTRVFAIGYEPKTAGIMEQLGLSGSVVDIAAANLARWAQEVERHWEEAEDPQSGDAVDNLKMEISSAALTLRDALACRA